MVPRRDDALWFRVVATRSFSSFVSSSWTMACMKARKGSRVWTCPELSVISKPESPPMPTWALEMSKPPVAAESLNCWFRTNTCRVTDLRRITGVWLALSVTSRFSTVMVSESKPPVGVGRWNALAVEFSEIGIHSEDVPSEYVTIQRCPAGLLGSLGAPRNTWRGWPRDRTWALLSVELE